MRNHGTNGHPADGDLAGTAVHVTGPGPDASDVVFDFSDLEQMRVQDLTVLLTARQVAMEEDRTVWAAGVPVRTWRILHAMGLGGFFKPFPTSDVEEA